jgi:tRNA A37 threonylcarbamoyladenosine dehydratase
LEEHKNNNWQERTELLLGKKNLHVLKSKHVLIVGLGGVGAYAAENICRAGVGNITIVDGDKIFDSNINRQLIALNSNIGKDKTKVLADRLKDINPSLSLTTINKYIHDNEMEELISNKFDYVVDAIDTLSPKFNLILNCIKKQIPLVSSMGAGAKTDPLKVTVSDISKSFNCNLARVLRKKLHKHNIRRGIKVVFSTELPDQDAIVADEGQNKKSTVGTISYMPPIFGCICASVVIRDLLNMK